MTRGQADQVLPGLRRLLGRKLRTDSVDWSVKRVSVSWHRWNEYRSLRPRREVALHWTCWVWAWFRFEVER